MPPGAASTTTSVTRVYQVPDSSSESGQSEDESVIEVLNAANNLKAAVHKCKSTVALASETSTPINDGGSSDEPLESHEQPSSPVSDSQELRCSDVKIDPQALATHRTSQDDSFPLEDSIAKEMGEVFDRAELKHDEKELEFSILNDLAMVHPSRREHHLRKRNIEDDEDDHIVPDTYEDDEDSQDSDQAQNDKEPLSIQKEVSGYSIYDSDRDEEYDFHETNIQEDEVAKDDRSRSPSPEDEVEVAGAAAWQSTTGGRSIDAIMTPFFSSVMAEQRASVHAAVDSHNRREEPNHYVPNAAPTSPYYSYSQPSAVKYPTTTAYHYTTPFEYRYDTYGSPGQSSCYAGSAISHGAAHNQAFAPLNAPLQTPISRAWFRDRDTTKTSSPLLTSSGYVTTAAKPVNLTKASISHILDSTAQAHDNTLATEYEIVSSRTHMGNSRDPRHNVPEAAGTSASYQKQLMLCEQQDQKCAQMALEHAEKTAALTRIVDWPVEPRADEANGVALSSNETSAYDTKVAIATFSATPTDSIELDWAALDQARKELDDATAKAKAEADSVKSGVAQLSPALNSYLSDGSDKESRTLRALSNGFQQTTRGWCNGKRTLGADVREKNTDFLGKPLSQAFMEARQSAQDDNDDDDESQASAGHRPAKRLRVSSSPATSSKAPESRDLDFFRPTTYSTKPTAPAKVLQQTSIDDTFAHTAKPTVGKTTAPKSTTPPTTTTMPTPPSSPAQIAAAARKIAADNSNQRVTRSRAAVVSTKSKEKSNGTSFTKTITPFMLGALAGGVGVFGALVGLPESYF